MNSNEFREFAKAAVDYIADYIDTIEDRKVISSVTPGYLAKLLPDEAPNIGEPWQDVLRDVDSLIMPGITHWGSPHFHAYYPTGNSYPVIVGEMLSAAFGCAGLNWLASPAYTELEAITMDWLAKMLHLPESYLNRSNGPGGGIIQSSASETTFLALLAAKDKMVREVKDLRPNLTESQIKEKLVAYSSDQANSSVEKAGLLGSMTMRLLPCDDKGQLRGHSLLEAVRRDKEQGLIPCYVVANLGTTPTCAFDKLDELGPICEKENIWLHVDAAYAGTAFVCPEYRYLMKGVEYTNSFNFNPHKWMMVNLDCSAMWVKDSKYVVDAFKVERDYLQDHHENEAPEYRHWQIPLGRRFRALKLWFQLRIYGVEGLQKHVRTQVGLAKAFDQLVRSDPRFESVCCSMGLVCFRLKGTNRLTDKLLERVTKRKNIYVIAGHFKDLHVIRFVICTPLTERRHVEFAWKEFSSQADEVVGKLECEKIVIAVAEKKPSAINEVIKMSNEMPRMVIRVDL